MPAPSSLDLDSRTWLAALATDAPRRDEAVLRLHALLLRAARFEVGRRRATMAGWEGDDLDDLAIQSADDALVAVLAKLGDFRGQSRFTTWAYKFALLEAAVKLRRRPWHGRELPLEPEGPLQLADLRASPHTGAEQELSAHQREVLLAVAVDGVPIDVLAERLGSTRGALYKTIHDARRKLRRRLDADGHDLAPAAGGTPA